jgi:hypothetical protein
MPYSAHGLLAQCDALVDQFIGVVGALALEAVAANHDGKRSAELLRASTRK